MAGLYTQLYLNGETVAESQVRVSIKTPAFKYGAMVFEGIRAYWNSRESQQFVFRLDDHAQRLLESIRLMRMETELTASDLSHAVLQTLRVNSVKEDVASPANGLHRW